MASLNATSRGEAQMTDSTASACCLGNFVKLQTGRGGEEARLSGCSEDDMIDRTGAEHGERVEVAVCAESRARRHDKP